VTEHDTFFVAVTHGIVFREHLCSDIVPRLSDHSQYDAAFVLMGVHLHPAQEEAEQPPQPEPDDGEDESPDPLPKPNFESRFSAFGESHFGQTTSGFEP